MNVLAVLTTPDAEPRRGADGKTSDRREAGSAFEGEVRSAGNRAAPAGGKGGNDEGAGVSRAASGKASAEEAPAEAEGEAGEASKARQPEGAEPLRTSEMLGLLAAASLRQRGAAEENAATGEGRAQRSETVAAGTGEAEQNQPATSEKARMRLSVLRMETHFEPVPNSAVLVETAAEATPATVSLRNILGAVAERGKPQQRVGERPAQVAAGDRLLQSNEILDVSADAPTVDFKLADRPEAARGRGSPLGGTAAADPLLLQDPAASERREAAPRAVARALAAAMREAERAALATPASGNAAASPAPTVSEQVAARVIDAFRPADASAWAAPARAPLEAELRMRAGGAALKTLTIQLQPEHLGTLDVSMRLVDGRLTLELAASQADTARLLLEDRAGLKSLLEGAGFSLDEAAISVVTRDAAPAAANAARSGGGGEGRPEAQRQGGESSGEGAGRGGEERRDPPRRETGAREGPHGPQRSGSVYL